MTWKELIDKILKMPKEEQNTDMIVYVPSSGNSYQYTVELSRRNFSYCITFDG